MGNMKKGACADDAHNSSHEDVQNLPEIPELPRGKPGISVQGMGKEKIRCRTEKHKKSV